MHNLKQKPKILKFLWPAHKSNDNTPEKKNLRRNVPQDYHFVFSH